MNGNTFCLLCISLDGEIDGYTSHSTNVHIMYMHICIYMYMYVTIHVCNMYKCMCYGEYSQGHGAEGTSSLAL